MLPQIPLYLAGKLTIWIVPNGSAISSVCVRRTCFHCSHIQICYITGLGLQFSSLVYLAPLHDTVCNSLKLGNTLEYKQIPSHRTELSRCTSVDSTNDLVHMLQTCSCAVRTQSDRCWSIKVSVILYVLSVDSFFVIPLASVVNRHILCYSE